MDIYWAQLLDIYAALPDTMAPTDRWKKAYIRYTKSSFEEELSTPSFDPPAVSPQEFAAQYAQAINYMMSVRTTQLTLPKDFMDKWRKAEDNQKG